MSEQVAAWFGDAKSSCAQVSDEAERRQEGFASPVVGGRLASCHTWIFVTAAKGRSGGLLCEQRLWQVTRCERRCFLKAGAVPGARSAAAGASLWARLGQLGLYKGVDCCVLLTGSLVLGQ